MGQMVEFEANGATADGYLAEPEGTGPGVVVLGEWWGLDYPMREIGDRFAEEGFVALVPDFYEGETTEEPDQAQQMMMALNMDEAEKKMRGAVKYVLEHPKCNGEVGSVGFCVGGGLSVWTASLNPKVGAAVVFYYVMPHGKPDFSKISGPVQGHFGTGDDFVSVDDAKALEEEIRDASGAEVEFHFYDGAGHAFFGDHNRLGTYDEEHAGNAWQRTVDFFKRHLAR